HGLVVFVIGLLSYFLKVQKNQPYVMPVLFAILFSISYESWLSASLNPYTSVFFIIVTIIGYQAIDAPVLEEEKKQASQPLEIAGKQLEVT
ncbi:MAG: hypothetical protein R2799_15805, partial [Crocinitomicaceae bacterium]